MNSNLLPNREGQTFDASKCFVTLDQIESMITKLETDLDQLNDKYSKSHPDNAAAYIISRIDGKISVLKDMRHMAYVNGGYRKE